MKNALSSKQRQMAVKFAMAEVKRQMPFIIARERAKVYAAMHNQGLAVSTINRVIDEMKYVDKAYSSNIDDEMADYMLIKPLQDLGVHLEMIVEEEQL